MSNTERQALRYLPLTEATFCVLAALAEPRHGYAVMQWAEAASGRRVKLGPGTLYGALTKLQGQGLIARVGETSADGERRKLYRLTALGHAVVEQERRRLGEMARIGRNLPEGTGGTNGK